MTGIEWETKDLAESDQCPAISVSRTPKILRMYVKGTWMWSRECENGRELGGICGRAGRE